MKIAFNAIVLGILVYIAMTLNEIKNTEKEIAEIEVESEMAAVYISDSLLCDYIKSLNIKFPNIVLAQAKLESGGYNSKLFRINKNLFGMRVAAQRATTAIGVGDFAKYNTWQESVLDYALWQNRIGRKFASEEDYLKYLGENYAEDVKYIEKIRGIVGSMENK